MPETSVTAHIDGYAVGVDFGTLSGRAVVVRLDDGAELGSAVHPYPHGVMDEVLAATGERLPPDWALQVPADYLDVLRHAVPAALANAGVAASEVVGIGTDFTACTVLPTYADGTPMCADVELAGRPHAYVKLWKHHAAQSHADRINALAHERGEAWINRYGGRISSEWAFAKALQLLEEDPDIYRRTELWVEAADWIVWQLTGEFVRGACVTGYKAIYQDGHFPSAEYLTALHPDFGDFVDRKLQGRIDQLGALAGRLSPVGAALTGLPEGIAVCVGNVDAHVTAPAVGAVEPGQLVAIMGTSTCHVVSAEVVTEVPGICGVVDGGIVPGLWGYEAGQSGVGDIFAWIVEKITPQSYVDEARAQGLSVHDLLAEKSMAEPVGAHGLVALDWHSGNRSVLVDHELSGLIVGLTLATRPEEIYRALLEATAFGTRTIVTALRDGNVPVTELIVAGGLAGNAILMQLYSDVTRLPISVARSAQAPAVGSAMHAAVAAGVYPDIHAAAQRMGRREVGVYQPDEQRAKAYDQLYELYVELHDHFGRGGSDAMHELRRIRREATA